MILTRSPRGEVGLDGSFVFPVWVRSCCVVGFPGAVLRGRRRALDSEALFHRDSLLVL
jgi:hypothetical protein